MITSPQNEKVKLVRKLIASRREREREALFVAEGEDLVAAGLASGREPVFLLKAAAAELDLPGADRAHEVKRKVLADVSSLGSGCRILGVWPQRWSELDPATEPDRLAGPDRMTVYVYLDGVSDPGNVGAIIRSTHALTGGTVVLGPDCADPFGPKAVRASMGSIFDRPPARHELERLPRPWLGLTAHGGNWPLAAGPAQSDRLTLCLGSERSGLDAAVEAACDALITIPLPGGAESLNVAAAAAICLERVSSLAVLATGSELDSPKKRTDA